MDKRLKPNYFNTKKSYESVLIVPLDHAHSKEQALRDYRKIRDKNKKEQAIRDMKEMLDNGGFIGL